MLQLRPYQERDVPRIRAAYAAGARAVLYVSPTGSGKTVGAAFIISSAVTRGNRVLFVAGRTELLGQTVHKLADAGVTDVRLIQAERDLGGPDAPVTVASIDTITQDGWLERLGDFELIIVDEAHHATCAKVRRILQRQNRARLLGLTATPMRGDKTPLSPPFDAMVVGPSVRELTELEHLVPCRLLCPPRDAKLPSNTLAMDPAEALQRYGTGAPAVVFCRDVKHSLATAAAIPGAGHIDGRMSAKRRAAVLAELAAGAIRVLCSVDVVTEGFDFPPLADAVMARKFGHVGRWIQAIGRVLRPAPGKTRATVIDLCGSAHEHGPPDAPRTYSLDGEGIAAPTRLAFRTCRACYAMFEAADACPHCGSAVPLAERAAPRIAGVELVDLTPKTPAPKREWITGPMPARFPGRCVRCAGAIRRGDEILFATLAKTTWHRRCPSTEMQHELR